MKRRYFTLVELLAAMAIILVLAGITVGGIMFATSRGDEARTVALMTEFADALEEYKNDYGSYPVFPISQKESGQRNYAGAQINFDDSVWDKFLNREKNKKDRPYFVAPDGVFKDGFDNVFCYSYPNRIKSRNTSKFVVWSMGVDGYHGGKKDIEDSSSTNDSNVNEARTDAGANGSDDICSWKQN